MNQTADWAPILVSLAALVLVGLALVLLHWAAPVVTPIMLAMYLAALAAPLYRWMDKWGWATGWSLAVLIAILALIFGGLGLLLLLSADRLQTGLGRYAGQLPAQLEALQSAQMVDSDATARAGATLNGVLLYFAGAIADVAGTLIFSTVVVALLLLELPRFQTLLQGNLGHRPLFHAMPTMAETAIQYFLIRTRLNVFTGLSAFLLFLLLGVDYAWLWGVLVFALSYVPYVGLFVAAVPPVLLAFAEYGLLRAGLVVIGVTVINVGIENVVAPVYTGRGLNLSPSVVFVAFFFWAWLLGPVGALLAMPITVLMLLILQQDERTLWLAEIIGGGRQELPSQGETTQ